MSTPTRHRDAFDVNDRDRAGTDTMTAAEADADARLTAPAGPAWPWAQPLNSARFNSDTRRDTCRNCGEAIRSPIAAPWVHAATGREACNA